MGIENRSSEGSPPEKEGAQWLRMLGLGNLIGTEITLKDGRRIHIEQFDEICGEHVRQAFENLGKMRPDHPERPELVSGLTKMVGYYVEREKA